MALKPPSRWGSSSRAGNGLNRRRERLSEMLVAQTYGKAANALLASNTFPEFEAKSGTVAGSATSSGTVSGARGGSGTVAGETTSSGTITGTKYEPDDETPAEPTSGGRGYYYYTAPEHPEPEPVPERKLGRVVGRTISFGTIIGRASRNGRSLSQAATARGEIRGTRATSGRVQSRAYLETRITATRRELRLTTHDDPDAEIRRVRDDADLLLIL